MANRREICCEDIVTLKADKKTKDRQIKNLETLYTPVAQLKVIFIICIFVLGSVFTYMIFVSGRVDIIKEDVTVILTTNKSIQKSIEEIKGTMKENKNIGN